MARRPSAAVRLFFACVQGGFVAALLWMTPCVFIALGQLNYYQRLLRKEEDGDVLPIVAPAAGSSAAGFSNSSKEQTAAPTGVAPPVRSGSTGSAAAAANVPSAPPRLQSLESAREQPAVVPVADTNGVN